jgi:hypothetical protein
VFELISVHCNIKHVKPMKYIAYNSFPDIPFGVTIIL